MQKNKNFATYLAQIDELMGKIYGVSIYDLPEVNYRDYYDDGLSVDDAVDYAIDDLQIEFGFRGEPHTWI